MTNLIIFLIYGAIVFYAAPGLTVISALFVTCVLSAPAWGALWVNQRGKRSC